MSNNELAPDRGFFQRLLETQYDAQEYELQSFDASLISDMRAVFRVALADGSSWVMRAYKSDLPMVDWLAGCGAAMPKEWLEDRAATLVYLAQHGYPAPRVVPTRSGASVGQLANWCALTTTFIEGDVVTATPETLRGMGAALGRLHCIDVANDAAVGKSWWYPEIAMPAFLEQYTTLLQHCPDIWRATIEDFQTAIYAIKARAALPQTIIHGDGWVLNAVQTFAHEVVLIDWEPSGLGIAVMDVGRLLFFGHLDNVASLRSPITPSEWRICAIIDGYCAQRTPTRAERDSLLDSIRCGIAFGAASHLLEQQRQGWPDMHPEHFNRRKWYEVSAEIAAIAQQRFDEIV